jgi:nicotinate-nucleotide adenylyltransferase
MSAFLLKTQLRVFFGGTFDPPHVAHHEMMKLLLRDSLVDFVHLVPARRNPLKLQTTGLGTPQERRQWIEVWIEVLRKEVPQDLFSKLKLECLEIDSTSKEASYTIDTLQTLEQCYPKSAWVLAGGSDLLEGLSAWKNISELLPKLHSFWIFPRNGSSSTELTIPLPFRALCDFRWIDSNLPPVSSSQIRQQIALLASSNASQNLEAPDLLPEIRKIIAEKKIQS